MNNSALLDSTLAMDSGVDGSVPENVRGVSSLLSEFNCTTKTSAAGIILIKEAGGMLNKIDLSVNQNIKIIASSANINAKLLEKLSNF